MALFAVVVAVDGLRNFLFDKLTLRLNIEQLVHAPTHRKCCNVGWRQWITLLPSLCGDSRWLCAVCLPSLIVHRCWLWMEGSLNNARAVARLTINHPPEELLEDLFIIMLLSIGNLTLFGCELSSVFDRFLLSQKKDPRFLARDTRECVLRRWLMKTYTNWEWLR